MRRLIKFLKHNHHKKLTLRAWIYTAYYRFLILHLPTEKLEKRIGARGLESEKEVPLEDMRTAYRIGREVCRIADRTPWESKCLVRSMTARRLLNREHIASTLYLGVGKEDGKMVAHSWLRCGHLYVTGGNGEGYAMVAKFLCQ